ncbi:MAG: hypothetical protein A2583_08250 [Bdellovibrionales bacterium RIFOXYD1_FULL_53_11]|nr:MAG: hypothetical protein A2583_08250 [Bdellovibrionales bacterium RIFOXYD1_FULL_53_11]
MLQSIMLSIFLSTVQAGVTGEAPSVTNVDTRKMQEMSTACRGGDPAACEELKAVGKELSDYAGQNEEALYKQLELACTATPPQKAACTALKKLKKAKVRK